MINVRTTVFAIIALVAGCDSAPPDEFLEPASAQQLAEQEAVDDQLAAGLLEVEVEVSPVSVTVISDEGMASYPSAVFFDDEGQQTSAISISEDLVVDEADPEAALCCLGCVLTPDGTQDCQCCDTAGCSLCNNRKPQT